MSQQLDSSAIKQVKDLVLSGYHLNDIHGLACPTALLPENTSVESLERFALERFRFRGAMDTTSIDDFVRYSVAYAQEEEKARCFIDADNMLARSIFNIGTLDNPGHADNVASIKLKKPPHSARYWRSTAITLIRSKSRSGSKTGAIICWPLMLAATR
jgi:uncharacterized protein YfdQ (DUF2303 family)